MTSGSVDGIASYRAADIGTGCGAPESTPSANATDLSARSISERWPSHTTKVLLLWRARIALGISRGAERRPTLSGPAIAVTTGAWPAEAVAVAVGAVSHTAHCESRPVWIGICVGAPTMPTMGPCGYLASSAALTNVGFFASPEIRRALVRFSAGCRRPATIT